MLPFFYRQSKHLGHTGQRIYLLFFGQCDCQVHCDHPPIHKKQSHSAHIPAFSGLIEANCVFRRQECQPLSNAMQCYTSQSVVKKPPLHCNHCILLCNIHITIIQGTATSSLHVAIHHNHNCYVLKLNELHYNLICAALLFRGHRLTMALWHCDTVALFHQNSL